MSQDFKLKFNQQKESFSSGEKPSEEDQNIQDEFYPSSGNSRNISFVLNDGNRKFLNYSYLISCDFYPNEKKVIMIFTTLTIGLWGENLEILFEKLSLNEVKKLIEKESRYNMIYSNAEYIVNEIRIEKANF